MPDVLQWLGGLVALVLFLGAVVVYLRGSKDKGTIETLERNNTALNERVALLEENEKRTTREHAIEKKALTDRVDALERENEVLRDVIGAKDEVAAMRGRLDEHHAAAMAGLIQLHEDLTEIATTLGQQGSQS